MSSLDLLPVQSSPTAESPASYEDSVSSEGVLTPLDVPSRDIHFLEHSADPLSINIPNKVVQPLIGTPFITDSASLFEYPFPPSSSRPPLSSASSSSSITSTPGPPSFVAPDKHIPHLFARLSNRIGSPGHRRTSSHGGLSPIPIPPRLRKLSGLTMDESTPTGHDIPTPRFDLSPRPDNQSDSSKRYVEALPPSRGTVAVQDRPLQSYAAGSTPQVIPDNEIEGLGLASTMGARAEIPMSVRRRSMPAVLNEEDAGYCQASSNEVQSARLRF